MAGSAGSSERAAERSRRSAAQRAAKKDYDELVERVQRDAGPASFEAKRAELAKLRDEYQALPQIEKKELDKLHSTAHERQKQKFLDGCFIDSASISGVGPARKAALRSFGIETAADVSRNTPQPLLRTGLGVTFGFGLIVEIIGLWTTFKHFENVLLGFPVSQRLVQ
jgi:DNA-binding helix-hairpin-helix protein with protein kinase domain